MRQAFCSNSANKNLASELSWAKPALEKETLHALEPHRLKHDLDLLRAAISSRLLQQNVARSTQTITATHGTPWPNVVQGKSSSSSSNQILMSCEPHRVTSGQSNSGHKQIHISKLFSRTYRPSVTSQTQNIHTQTSNANFRRVSPFSTTHVKRAHKARTCWYHQGKRKRRRYKQIQLGVLSFVHAHYNKTQ